MKALLTFIFLISYTITVAANASIPPVETLDMNVKVITMKVDTTQESKSSVARLYRFKNSRVKQALEFRTKRNSRKLA